jgi:hypothetical protein
MSDTFSSSSLRSLIKFPFQSPNWKGRFLIGSGLLLGSAIIPILPALLVYGYAIRVMRQAIRGEPLELPEWSDWGGLAKDGARSFVEDLLFMAPGTIVLFAGWAVYMVASVWGSISLNAGATSDAASRLPLILMFGAMGIFFVSMFLGWFLIMLGLAPFPAALAHFVAQDKVGAALHVREWSKIIKADKWGYLVSWVVILGLGGILYFAFMLVYFLGIFCFPIFIVFVPVGLYLILVAAAVFGQFYREGAGEALAADPHR